MLVLARIARVFRPIGDEDKPKVFQRLLNGVWKDSKRTTARGGGGRARSKKRFGVVVAFRGVWGRCFEARRLV